MEGRVLLPSLSLFVPIKLHEQLHTVCVIIITWLDAK
jgi:hypothetical protein